ncbi:MAG: ribonuclease Y [Candidatus Jacksonbacteria bacterium RIFOXYA2_FULL_44_7]|uniref:Ribonuclease Y n=1 Tax=Candidatus Jacksonbacteria bacterium RIFCSPLOWO2_02_FULL_44_20 TaxID=1798460 RepID=A0A1G2AA90_9BACT|nr:MAG: Ribonuclease Y [Parcubacteria group bacterium GW2011_GWC2_44_17]KKT50505.1 MAG: Ribonuclease Y [Parcubacteria group bacterium GW2011_GWF2_44_17]OGY70770.1 MAG: ribonuclease Y [Candidatus Jacksonbacteria bacterium RIFCSPHIGHO2_02_FULL_44_25]OGY72197.1 MAG: ribonuclease Y [Candidatus Jacksonbacteria bacterium RIFCSPHIGHO2_12_FULL_44_12]OGY72957.1 MAG: ribonuclease Y [Candidatus Jacksonbacteria bacterium RIFCSPLOWO2_02_FULL_44_20]OGY73259.1 MAG: ribonuclease Y [Candidatus Jacksonbacteria 
MLITIVFIIIALAIGVIFGYSVRAFIVAKQIGSAERKAKDILDNAKDKEKEILIKAKEKAIAAIDEVKREESELKHELRVRQERLEKREEVFDAKLLELERSKEEYQKKLADVDELKAKALEVKEEQVKKLEKIAGLTIDEAKEVLFKNTEERIKDELATRIRKLEAESSYEVEKRAKHVIATAMQRVASSVAQETTITSVVIPSEEMKGRIIGKEGRNIKTIERLTGTEIVIDETPNTIWISGYSPIRRHWCRIALEKLILDGRIHPGRIEEAVLEAKTDLARDIQKAGEEAAYQAGVVGLDPKLIRILGRLKYRTSYGQNVLQHSVEVALISKMLAEELGGDVAMCTKGGLLHDIGKAVDHEVQGAHPEIGYEIMKKFNLPEEIAYMAISHHEDNPKTLEGIINKVADAISGSRPGARKDTFENYVQRLQELEDTAKQFKGVSHVYAIYAGREVRVFVTPTEIGDLEAIKLARDIADKIETELKYPGEIKVTVIRETRVDEYAR